MIVVAVFLLAVLVVSIIGLVIYLKTLKWVAQYVEKVPDISIFILFLIYGLTIFLTSSTAIFGWSGVSSILMLFLLCAAPWIILIIAIDSLLRWKKSIVHRYMFCLSMAYLVGLVLLLVIVAPSFRLL